MYLAFDCPTLANVATISGFYAQLTGVLAGFAFTAMVVLLAPTQVDERDRFRQYRDSGVMSALFAAFIALVIATLTYSVLAGEPITEARARASTEELVDGIPFGLAAIMLFQGVALLLHAGEMDRILVWTGRVFAAVIGPFLTLYYVTNGATDTEAIRAARLTGSPCVEQGAPVVGTVLSFSLLALLCVSLIPTFQPRRLREAAQKRRSTVPIAILGLSILIAVVGGSLDVQDPTLLMSQTVLNIYLSVVFVLLLLIGVTIALGGSGGAPPPTVVDGASPPDPAKGAKPLNLVPTQGKPE